MRNPVPRSAFNYSSPRKHSCVRKEIASHLLVPRSGRNPVLASPFTDGSPTNGVSELRINVFFSSKLKKSTPNPWTNVISGNTTLMSIPARSVVPVITPARQVSKRNLCPHGHIQVWTLSVVTYIKIYIFYLN